MILKKEWPKKGEENLVKLLITAQELSKFYKNNKWQNDIIIFDASWYLPNVNSCLLYTSPSPRDQRGSRMPACA